MDIRKFVGLSLVACFFASCGASYKPSPIVTDKEQIEKLDSPIIIMRVQWEEEIHDGSYVSLVRSNQDLMREKSAQIEFHRVTQKTELSKPLHYISNLKMFFQFEEPSGGKAGLFVERYNLDLKEYDEIAIHAFEENDYEWSSFQYSLEKYGVLPRGEGANPSKKYSQKHIENFYSVKLEKGKIYYLGDIKFHFKTTKLQVTSTSADVNADIDLEKIVMSNNFYKMKRDLYEKNPEIPIHDIINLSGNRIWNMKSPKKSGNYVKKKGGKRSVNPSLAVASLD